MQGNHQHVEAFCLMTYASNDGSVRERLWNSRDGVTPFIIVARDGTTELTHVDWHLDEYRPDYRPRKGERVFVSITPEMARDLAVKKVEFFWEHPDYPMSKTFETKEEAVEEMFRIYMQQPDAPTVIEWPDERAEVLSWPERPTCHNQDPSPFAQQEYMHWRESRGTGVRDVPYQTCGYCGSLHPAAMLRILRDSPIHVEVVSWKYGWPHKIYVTHRNDRAQEQAEIGSDSRMINGERVTTPIMGEAGHFTSKFYTQHLMDEGYSDDAFAALADEIDRVTGIRFSRAGERLRYQSRRGAHRGGGRYA